MNHRRRRRPLQYDRQLQRYIANNAGVLVRSDVFDQAPQDWPRPEHGQGPVRGVLVIRTGHEAVRMYRVGHGWSSVTKAAWPNLFLTPWSNIYGGIPVGMWGVLDYIQPRTRRAPRQADLINHDLLLSLLAEHQEIQAASQSFGIGVESVVRQALGIDQDGNDLPPDESQADLAEEWVRQHMPQAYRRAYGEDQSSRSVS